MFPLASAWPLRLDIEPGTDKSEIVDAIIKAGRPDIGAHSGDAFYSGLLNAGGAFVVRDLARYRPMLDSNMACWEEWGSGAEVNHAWTACPGYLLQKYILGTWPTSGGFATFDVRPATSGLAFAEGAVPTVKSFITTRWEKDAHDRFTLSIDVPPNARASIYISRLSTGYFTLTESGKVLWPARHEVKRPGTIAVQEKDLSIKCLAGSGIYSFGHGPQSMAQRSCIGTANVQGEYADIYALG